MVSKKLLITGASGWLGKSLLNTLKFRKENFSDILLVGSKDRLFSVYNDKYAQVKWNLSEVKSFSPTHIFHLAALTRDKLDVMSSDLYIEKNQIIQSLLAETLNIKTVKHVIITSSGAADFVRFPGNSIDLYAIAKKQEEIVASSFISNQKIINILRIYSVSGRFINKIHKLAFANLIQQAKRDRKISILANKLVYRQYVDAEELMAASLELFNFEASKIYNSGGIKVELRELARIVADLYSLDHKYIFYREITNKNIDDYTSEFNILPGIKNSNISSLTKQIQITSPAI